MITNEAVTHLALPVCSTWSKQMKQVWHTCTYTHTFAEYTHRQNTQFYPLTEGVRELHEVALTLVIIVHSERMSRSEPRKPLNFPQRGRKKEWAKWVKGGGRGQMEKEKKGVTKCVPNEKRRQDEKDYSFPGGTSLTFKEPFRGSCTSVPFQPNSSSSTNNKQWHRAGQFSSNSQQFSTWPKLLNSADLKWIHPGVSSHRVESMSGYYW